MNFHHLQPLLDSETIRGVQIPSEATGIVIPHQDSFRIYFSMPEGWKPSKDELSKREYTISGLCQDCQDKIFGSDPDDEDEDEEDDEDDN